MYIHRPTYTLGWVENARRDVNIIGRCVVFACTRPAVRERSSVKTQHQPLDELKCEQADDGVHTADLWFCPGWTQSLSQACGVGPFDTEGYPGLEFLVTVAQEGPGHPQPCFCHSLLQCPPAACNLQVTRIDPSVQIASPVVAAQTCADWTIPRWASADPRLCPAKSGAGRLLQYLAKWPYFTWSAAHDFQTNIASNSY